MPEGGLLQQHQQLSTVVVVVVVIVVVLPPQDDDGFQKSFNPRSDPETVMMMMKGHAKRRGGKKAETIKACFHQYLNEINQSGAAAIDCVTGTFE